MEIQFFLNGQSVKTEIQADTRFWIWCGHMDVTVSNVAVRRLTVAFAPYGWKENQCFPALS